MKILAIETSGSVGGVALLEDGRLLAERIFEQGMVHGRELAPSIQRLMRETESTLDEVGLVAVDIGPGSFTGLRVGLAAAKGLCLALGTPVRGVVSLDALAEPARGKAPVLCPLLDAKWDQIYGAVYAPDRGEIFQDKPEDALRRLPSDALLLGTALARHEKLFAGRATLGPEFAHPRPSTVGLLAARDFAAGKQDDARTLVPLYLRPTEAEVKFGGK